MADRPDRRTFIRNSLAVPAAAALALEAGRNPAAAQAAGAPAPMDTAARGRIGDIEVSRLLLGGNLLTHYTHSRDLKYVYNLAAHYNTEEKILDTLAIAEQHGINTLVVHTVPRTLAILKRYRQQMGGKIQWIICPTAPVEDDMSAYAKQVEEIVGDGTEAVYLWGVHSDRLAAQGRADLMARAVAIAKDLGVPSGVGAHDLKAIVACEEHGVEADFYIKTLHHHNYPSGPKPEELTQPYNEIPGYWCQDPQAVIDFMKSVEKPWIAFKVMAAGAIPPKDAFQYVFNAGADHVLAGMFDFEIPEDAAILRDALSAVNRTRPWRS
ncbi:MAG: hypothetical protein JXR94_20250 [Candidatus Hydrogenedentes bacterium]|nr:hypothetical protein [Candidatus Hydrogenedentota bacterium]